MRTAAEAAVLQFCLLGRCQTTLLEQWRDVRITVTKGAIEIHWVCCVPSTVDVFEARGEPGIKDIASLGEGGIPVGLQYFRPEIGVIPGGIATAGEQMLEVRRAVTQPDFFW